MNFGVLVIASWQAFEARNIQSEFAETKFIGLCVFFLAQAFLTGIPVVAITRGIPEAFYLVLCCLLVTLCLAVLGFVFVPKIGMHRAYRQLSPAEQRQKMLVSIQLSQSAHLPQSSSHHQKHKDTNTNKKKNDNAANEAVISPQAKDSMADFTPANLAEDSSGALASFAEDSSNSGALVKKRETLSNGRIRVSSYIDDIDFDEKDDGDGDDAAANSQDKSKSDGIEPISSIDE